MLIHTPSGQPAPPTQALVAGNGGGVPRLTLIRERGMSAVDTMRLLQRPPSSTTLYLDSTVFRWFDDEEEEEPDLDVALGVGEVVDFEGNDE